MNVIIKNIIFFILFTKFKLLMMKSNKTIFSVTDSSPNITMNNLNKKQHNYSLENNYYSNNDRHNISTIKNELFYNNNKNNNNNRIQSNTSLVKNNSHNITRLKSIKDFKHFDNYWDLNNIYNKNNKSIYNNYTRLINSNSRNNKQLFFGNNKNEIVRLNSKNERDIFHRKYMLYLKNRNNRTMTTKLTAIKNRDRKMVNINSNQGNCNYVLMEPCPLKNRDITTDHQEINQANKVINTIQGRSNITPIYKSFAESNIVTNTESNKFDDNNYTINNHQNNLNNIYKNYTKNPPEYHQNYNAHAAHDNKLSHLEKHYIHPLQNYYIHYDNPDDHDDFDLRHHCNNYCFCGKKRYKHYNGFHHHYIPQNYYTYHPSVIKVTEHNKFFDFMKNYFNNWDDKRRHDYYYDNHDYHHNHHDYHYNDIYDDYNYHHGYHLRYDNHIHDHTYHHDYEYDYKHLCYCCNRNRRNLFKYKKHKLYGIIHFIKDLFLHKYNKRSFTDVYNNNNQYYPDKKNSDVNGRHNIDYYNKNHRSIIGSYNDHSHHDVIIPDHINTDTSPWHNNYHNDDKYNNDINYHGNHGTYLLNDDDNDDHYHDGHDHHYHDEHHLNHLHHFDCSKCCKFCKRRNYNKNKKYKYKKFFKFYRFIKNIFGKNYYDDDDNDFYDNDYDDDDNPLVRKVSSLFDEIPAAIMIIAMSLFTGMTLMQQSTPINYLFYFPKLLFIFILVLLFFKIFPLISPLILLFIIPFFIFLSPILFFQYFLQLFNMFFNNGNLPGNFQPSIPTLIPTFPMITAPTIPMDVNSAPTIPTFTQVLQAKKQTNLKYLNFTNKNDTYKQTTDNGKIHQTDMTFLNGVVRDETNESSEKRDKSFNTLKNLYLMIHSVFDTNYCLERAGCHWAINTKYLHFYNKIIFRILETLTKMISDSRFKRYTDAYRIGSLPRTSHDDCISLFYCKKYEKHIKL